MHQQKNVPLSGILFFVVFVNGFEAGGYQACLLPISRQFSLNDTLMGMLASVQLIAILLAPMIFGRYADRRGKKKVLQAFFLVFIMGCVICLAAKNAGAFLIGIFLVGFSTSILQYVSIAALSDAYPATGQKKMGILTAMYALGAFAAPLLCGYLEEKEISWQSLFVMLLFCALLLFVLTAKCNFSRKEMPSTDAKADIAEEKWMLPGILLLCAIMFVYVGFENGYAFFLNSLLTETTSSRYAYIALSMFWLAMLPSRILCGYLGRRKGLTLVIAVSIVTVGTVFLVNSNRIGVIVVTSFILGFFSGMVYPSVLNNLNDFAAKKTATAAGMITAATGLGGAMMTTLIGRVSELFGIRTGFCILAGWMGLDIVLAVLLRVCHHKIEKNS